MLIGLHGKKRTGKDTIAMYLRATHNFSRAAIADPIYAGVGAAFGLDPRWMEQGENREKPIDHLHRRSLRDLVKEMGRMGREFVGPDVWLSILEARIAGHLKLAEDAGEDVPGIVVSDIRLEHEATWIRESGGVVVHVLRDTGLQDSDVTEAGILFQPKDKQIDNNGSLQDLGHKIDTLIRHLKRETPAGILLPAGAQVH